MKKVNSSARFAFLAAALPIFLSACNTLQEYQKMYVNDSDMELVGRKAQKFEYNSQLYREGASGANGGKTGGGCGCN